MNEVGNEAGVYGLLSSEMSKFEQDKEHWGLSVTSRIYLGYTGFDISKEEVSPDGSEVIFYGSLKASREENPDADITIRVAKESAGGRWSIRFIKLKPRKQDKGK